MAQKFETIQNSNRSVSSKNLMKLRKEMGFSQAQLAKEWNVHSGTVALWETGRRSIPGPVKKLIQIYDKHRDILNHE